jgi:methylmalonyl-CoA mutase
MNALETRAGVHAVPRDPGVRDELSAATDDAVRLCKLAGFDLVFVETSGIGQGDAAITRLADVTLYVMTAEFGAPSSSRRSRCSTSPTSSRSTSSRSAAGKTRSATCAPGPAQPQALRRRDDESLPVFGTVASRFADAGVTRSTMA